MTTALYLHVTECTLGEVRSPLDHFVMVRIHESMRGRLFRIKELTIYYVVNLIIILASFWPIFASGIWQNVLKERGVKRHNSPPPVLKSPYLTARGRRDHQSDNRVRRGRSYCTCTSVLRRSRDEGIHFNPFVFGISLLPVLDFGSDDFRQHHPQRIRRS